MSIGVGSATGLVTRGDGAGSRFIFFFLSFFITTSGLVNSISLSYEITQHKASNIAEEKQLLYFTEMLATRPNLRSVNNIHNALQN